MRNLAVAILLSVVAFSPATLARAAPLRVLAFGDSLTQGYGLDPGEGLVPVLEAWLRARGHDVTLINAGVSGDTTAGGKARIGWALGEGADAVIVALGGNDMLRGLPPAEARANLDAVLAAVAPRPVLLVGLSAPGNFGPEYKAEFDAVYPDLAAAHGALLLPDLLSPLTGQADQVAVLRDLMQPDGIHPNAKGVTLVVEALGPRVEELLARVAPASGG
ncbi:MAG: arylesterase [Paracoccaceae bacterium]